MHSLLHRGAVVAAGLGLAAGVLAMSPAAQAVATNVIQVRPADLIDPQGVTGAATQQFLAEGVHIKTTNGSPDGARAHFKVGVPLNQIHKVEYEWFGTTTPTPANGFGAPGILYDVDINGDGKADGELVGELYYGGTDVWLNDNATFPNTTLAPLSPCGGTFGQDPQNGNQDGCAPPNGAGDIKHGTLDDWTRSLALNGKQATVVSGGWIASGLVYDGVLRSATYGPNQYTFTNLAKSKVTATAAAKHATVKKGNKIVIKGTATPVGPGAKVTLEVKKNGKWKTVETKDLAASGEFKLKGKAGKVGKAKYRVTVSETNSTAAATSNKVKVKIVKK